MGSLLAVATVFVGLRTLNIYIIRETKLPIEPKMQGGGGLIREGGYLWDSTVHTIAQCNYSRSVNILEHIGLCIYMVYIHDTA
jgi:hypothetical protein